LVLLIYPPVAKPCEPPAGISRLAGILNRQGVEHVLLDANLEGLLQRLGLPLDAQKTPDAWTKRAFKNCARNVDAVRDRNLYRHLERYKRAVNDIGKVLRVQAQAGTVHGLADFEQQNLSPLKSRDLLAAADTPELNPYYRYFSARLRELFETKQPALVGLSLSYLSQALCAFAMMGFIRREIPNVRIVLGGGLVTSWVKNETWKNPFAGLVDHVVAGPGEFQLLSLLGRGTKSEVMPRPDYRSLPRERYLAPGFILPYSAATGCYWNKCTFCPEEAEGNPYQSLPPRQVVADLKALREETNPSLIHLLDNAISPALLAQLCADPVGAPWYGFSRIGAHLADADFCRALKQAGCVMLKLGIESGDQHVLDALGKGIRVETSAAVLRNLRQAGIATYVYLLFGTPAENAAGARKTLEFATRHGDCIDFLNLALFSLPTCGKAAAALETQGFSEGDLSLYTDFRHPRGWDRKSVRGFIQDVFRKHPAIAPILKREAPIFTANHAPFFVMGRS